MLDGEPAIRQLLLPGRTVALILGAQEWPRAAHINGGPAFARSAADLRDYLLDSQSGLGLHDRDVLDLFDSERTASDQIDAVGDFLSEREQDLTEAGNEGLRDVIVYYVGHGAFPEASNRLFMLVRRSKPDLWDTTCILADSLARRIHMSVPFARQFVILDCCFSGAAARAWMAGAGAQGNMLRATLENEVPVHGAVLICSSASDMVSMCPEGSSHTMFTGSLLTSLRKGSPRLGQSLSLLNVRDLAWSDMQQNWHRAAVRPVLVPIDRGAGDFSRHGAFPNPSADVVRPTPSDLKTPSKAQIKAILPEGSAQDGTAARKPITGALLEIASRPMLRLIAAATAFYLIVSYMYPLTPPDKNETQQMQSDYMVFFDYAKIEITPAAATALNDLLGAIRKSGYSRKIIVAGYSEEKEFAASEKRNQLSRALAVKDYLVKRGIPSERIVAISYQDLEAQKQLGVGRRVQIILM